MSRVHVVYASRHGGTAGIATRIAEILRAQGHDVVLSDAADRPEAAGFDATLVGSGVYLGSWVKDGVEFLERNQATLSRMPVWLFSSGPLPGSTKETDSADPLTVALGPEEGPGSGGHRKINELSEAIKPRDHRVFRGAYDPKDPPANMTERLVRLMPASKSILPAGDFREWDAIEAWARDLAREVGTAVEVG